MPRRRPRPARRARRRASAAPAGSPPGTGRARAARGAGCAARAAGWCGPAPRSSRATAGRRGAGGAAARRGGAAGRRAATRRGRTPAAAARPRPGEGRARQAAGCAASLPPWGTPPASNLEPTSSNRPSTGRFSPISPPADHARGDVEADRGGEDVIITDHGRAVARLIALQRDAGGRQRPGQRPDRAVIAYLDTSALIKLVVTEDGAEQALRLWDVAGEVVVSRLAWAEALAALAAARRDRRLKCGATPTGRADGSVRRGRGRVRCRRPGLSPSRGCGASGRLRCRIDVCVACAR
jgi:antitoxin (DNA-binding transcriptional repressor) of toxin-antitoxin stability system